MKIKDRIALYFTLISTSMLLFVLCMVYLTFMEFLKADFFERLTDRSMVTAKLYLEADEISIEALTDVRHEYLQKLSGEVTRIYDYKDQATFIDDSSRYWTRMTIEHVRKQKHLQFSDGERQVVGIYYKDNQGDFVILASAIDQGSQNRLSKLLKIMIFVFVAISFAVLLLSRWIAAEMLKPLNKFMIGVQQIGHKNMEFRVEESSAKDEISLIAKSFNQLMNELEQAFVLQKTFVANASHELRTPVTRMMMASELALSKDRDVNTYKEVIHSVIEDAEKMDSIITGLLAMAKMDMELINSQLSSINLYQILRKIQADWKQHKNLGIEILNDLGQNDLFVFANETLLQIALDNIFSNAFKFSNNQIVICRLAKSDENFLINITDQGPGIPLSAHDEVFKPFYSRSAEAGHSGEGMGLYMAHKIISLFNGKIEIASSIEAPNTFIVSIPEF
ncbi:histidine kinase [Pedobacter sp. Leaf216]|uniref:sensor histidine kinase n=1 Tax=Pedobacter sp. Leaf216 TaxID=1735684 RepID=UPI0006F4356B|nr:HAMP domain-containing sensor histidine kinase [Pedobacter sp. Leaf216]KQM69259.1 histidine kinase [Pedobacter sp. Leaf216]